VVFRAKPSFNLVLEAGSRHQALVLATQTPVGGMVVFVR